MSLSDVFGDCLARVRNAQMARLPYTDVISSRVVSAFCKIMKEEGYIESYDVSQRTTRVVLRYTSEGIPVIRNLKRVSKLGCRVYIKKKNIRMICRGLGMQIISTSRGIMQSYIAKEVGVGGEVLCSVF